MFNIKRIVKKKLYRFLIIVLLINIFVNCLGKYLFVKLNVVDMIY